MTKIYTNGFRFPSQVKAKKKNKKFLSTIKEHELFRKGIKYVKLFKQTFVRTTTTLI